MPAPWDNVCSESFYPTESPGRFARAIHFRFRSRDHVQVRAFVAPCCFSEILSPLFAYFWLSPVMHLYMTKAMLSSSCWNASNVLPRSPTRLTAVRAASAETP